MKYLLVFVLLCTMCTFVAVAGPPVVEMQDVQYSIEQADNTIVSSQMGKITADMETASSQLLVAKSSMVIVGDPAMEKTVGAADKEVALSQEIVSAESKVIQSVNQVATNDNDQAMVDTADKVPISRYKKVDIFQRQTNFAETRLRPMSVY